MEDKTIQNSQWNWVQWNWLQPTIQDKTNTADTWTKQWVITVIIKDPQWNEVWQFIAEDGKNIAELAAMHWINIPVSCGAGVCGVCLCKVEEWKDVVKWDAFNSPLMPRENDENWNPKEVLTCIAGFNPEKFNDWQNHTVILQRTY
jgi:ferredoxin